VLNCLNGRNGVDSIEGVNVLGWYVSVYVSVCVCICLCLYVSVCVCEGVGTPCCIAVSHCDNAQELPKQRSSHGAVLCCHRSLQQREQVRQGIQQRSEEDRVLGGRPSFH